jgi:hypothetical protein
LLVPEVVLSLISGFTLVLEMRFGDRQTNASALPKLHLKSQFATPAACGLEELFSTVLERFLQPIHAPRVYCKN